VALGEHINVSERIEGKEWNEETYPAGLQEACIMRFIFGETLTCRTVSLFGNYWTIILDNLEYKNPVFRT